MFSSEARKVQVDGIVDVTLEVIYFCMPQREEKELRSQVYMNLSIEPIIEELEDLFFNHKKVLEKLGPFIFYFYRGPKKVSFLIYSKSGKYTKYIMAYGDKVIDHFNNPRNVGTLDKSKSNVGTGLVGAPECGDVMRLQIEVNDNIITDAKFKTFGCGSAIAASSLATEWLKGMSIDDAIKLDNMELVEELSLPPVKIHCSVLAEDAIKEAIKDYRQKQGSESII